MEYINLIQKTIDYVDANIHDNLSVDDLAKIAGFSTYHYYKIFSSFVNLSVMDYVTKRKLQFALHDLAKGGRIIDIAMDYGFETHAGFNKAFKRTFGYPPSLYRLHAPKGLPPKINLLYLKENLTGGIVMEPKIIDMHSFKVAGYEFKNNLKNVLRSKDIPAFWSHRGFDGNNCEERLYKQLNPQKHGEYCICVNTDMNTDDFSYVMAVAVDNFDKASEDMYKLEIPSATYAVFTTPPVHEDEFVSSIKGTWTYILQHWFPNSQYEIDESKLDFEYYDEHCHPSEYDKISMQIYIPIKRI
ncbi:AraC family transcriptional regulator [Clostridium hydrogeniformans]|uniref:AraC family transcriptional regulator n=1 Tax=Clostridium hydrogeniformans TaxID=349933 RepID=UPI00048227A0|nr:AraC family transcriptional regulator [Clostridium hydrogeniformans]